MYMINMSITHAYSWFSVKLSVVEYSDYFFSTIVFCQSSLKQMFTPNRSKFVWRVHKGHKTLLCISIPLAFNTKVNEGLLALEYNDSYMIKITCCSSRIKAQLIRTIIIGNFTPKDLKRLYKLTSCSKVGSCDLCVPARQTLTYLG
jgi:hypothetical protein